MLTYYPGKINSIQTTLVSAIDTVDSTITVTNISVFPAAPNLATIGVDSAAETILYTGISGSDLTGVTRGFQGTAASWAIGATIARYFTAYDHDTVNQNVETLNKSLMWGGI
jgi:hypothetical protein